MEKKKKNFGDLHICGQKLKELLWLILEAKSRDNSDINNELEFRPKVIQQVFR